MATPISVRKVCDRLNRIESVNHYIERNNRISVYFNSGITENWWFRAINLVGGIKNIILPDEEYLGVEDDLLPILHQFEYDPLDPKGLDKYFALEKERYLKAKFIPIRIAINELIRLYLYEDLEVLYTNQELINDFKDLINDDLEKTKYGKAYRIYYSSLRNRPGYKLITYFINFKIKEKTPSRTLMSIEKCIRSYIDLTYNNMAKYYLSDSTISPSFYNLLFKKFKITNMNILDLDPDFGSKLLASIINGNTYSIMKTNYFYKYEKFAKFLDGEIRTYDENEYYDVIILKNEDQIEKWKDKCSCLLFWTENHWKYDKIYKLNVLKTICDYSDISHFVLI